MPYSILFCLFPCSKPPVEYVVSAMMRLESENHSDQVLAALQNKNGCDILLIGKDNVSSHSDSLWIFSPLVRSIIDSLRNVDQNLLIIPDFSSEDIKTVLDIIDTGRDGTEVCYNFTTKDLLETLGLNLKNKNCSNSDVKEEREDFVQVMLLAPNSDFEFNPDDDETESEAGKVKIAELTPKKNIKIENDKKVLRAQLEMDILDPDKSTITPCPQDHLDPNVLREQKLQEVKWLLSNENGIWTCRKCEKTFQTKCGLRKHSELHVKGLLYSCHRCEQIFHKKSSLNFHKQNVHRPIIEREKKQKLAKLEVEELLLREGAEEWRCKSCMKIFPLKHSLRLHAERHVSSLSFPCSRCSSNFPTRIRLRGHQWEKHRKLVRDESEEGEELTEAEKNKLRDLHQEKLREVENLVIEDSGRWKCKECSKTFAKRVNLLYHAEAHVSGLYYPCGHCSKTFNTRSKLGRHRFDYHKDKARKYIKDLKGEPKDLKEEPNN